MMDSDHLHLLIHEEIYKIPDKKTVNTYDQGESKTEKAVVAEEAPVDKKILNHEHHDETPKIPAIQHETPAEEKVVPVAIFHEATDASQLELLQNIINACKLSVDQYQVFANGFNKEVKFKKAVVFVQTAKVYYESVPYQQSQILCSKPLNILTQDKQEKAKLWQALQSFL
ncbi:MAG: hypothetical protein Tsb0034_03930 [Ekhidna sp.]